MNLLVSIMVVLVIIIIVVVTVRLINLEGDMVGVWVGSPDYMKTAGLSKFYLYISPDHKGGRLGYLVMSGEDGDIIANQYVRLTYSTIKQIPSVVKSLFTENHIYNISSVDVEFPEGGKTMSSLTDPDEKETDIETGDDNAPIPADISISYDPKRGSLTLHSDSKLYGHLYKDGWLSSTAEDEYEQMENQLES